MKYSLRRKPRRPPTTFLHLPEELVLKILYKLPTRTLLHCICVCKYWSSLIKNSYFISTHLGNTLFDSSNNNKKKNSDCLLLIRRFKHGLIRYTLHLGTKEEKKGQISFSLLKERVHGIEVIGLCNGLVCLSDRFCERIILWNPPIKKSYILPVVEENVLPSLRYVGLGFDSNTNDFKVLKITKFQVFHENPQVHTRVELFSLNANSWRCIDSTCLSKYKFDSPKYHHLSFASKSLHLATSRVADTSMTLIIGFDLFDEVFREITLPESLKNVKPTCLDVLGHEGESSIAVSYTQHGHDFDYNGVFELWVMRTHGVVESWTKLCVFTNYYTNCNVLGFRKNGHVLLQIERYKVPNDLVEEHEVDNGVMMDYTGGSLYSVNPNSMKPKLLKIWRNLGISYISSYVESLALLDRGSKEVIADK